MSQIFSASELEGIFGNSSAENTANFVLLLPAFRKPRSGFTSKIKSSDADFFIMLPNIIEGTTATPGSTTFTPSALHLTEVFKSVASSMTFPSSEAVMKIPPIESFAALVSTNLSAICQASKKA